MFTWEFLLDSYLVEALPTDVLSVAPLPAANNTCLKYVSKSILLIEWWSKAFVSKHNWITNFAGLSRIGSSVLVAFNFNENVKPRNFCRV